jgi:bifunctional UDP-N-acetylglucosamine pyrophosphorylase / glucosamine-1-phosphate N-acetyltransferase
MAKFNALVAAAGRGQRAGLPYPKTLFPVQGVPILVRLLRTLEPWDARPTVVVSPDGVTKVQECLDGAGLRADLVIQSAPKGMGDAVLQFEQSRSATNSEHVLLVWGDIPFIQSATIEALVQAHLDKNSDFTLATRQVESAYTIVSRGHDGRVTGVVETREAALTAGAGERDIGLFVFRPGVVLPLLREELPGRTGRHTGEHGFLYVIAHLVARGHKVVALPVATELDLVSLNSMKDIDAYL